MKKISPSMIVSIIALVVAMSGASYAADSDIITPVGQTKPPHIERTAQASNLTNAELAARSYWGNPDCGTPSVSTFPLPGLEVGTTLPSECRIVLDPAVVQKATTPYGYFQLCRAVAHEWGHLSLGDTYFQTSNPQDPAHSLDLGNLMYASLGTTTPSCLASMPHFALLRDHFMRMRVYRQNDVCVAERRHPLYVSAWPCLTTDPVSQNPAPRSYAANQHDLMAMITTSSLKGPGIITGEK